MDNLPRKITIREIYNERYLRLHKICMEMAIEEAKDMAKRYEIPIELFNISALTFQLFKIWLDKLPELKRDRDKKQQELNEAMK